LEKSQESEKKFQKSDIYKTLDCVIIKVNFCKIFAGVKTLNIEAI